MDRHLILIDTSTDLCSVAVANLGGVIAEKVDDSSQRKHASLLPLMINEVLKSASLALNHVSVIAYSKGPGSYTGLRVGLSSAKGICFAKKIPLIGVSTLEALAHSVVNTNGDDIIISMIDAGRNEVFQAVYTSDYKLLSSPCPQILDKESYLELATTKNKVHLVGDGSPKSQNLLTPSDSWVYGTDKMLASYLYIPARNKFLNSDFEDLAYATPDYLKAPEYKKKQVNI